MCENLLVPVCLSSSHISYGSIRMEPVFMILGQSGATAAALAIDANQPVQNVAYSVLQKKLLEDGQVIEYASPAKQAAKGSIDLKTLSGVVVDDEDAQLTGDWQVSRASSKYVGDGYRHDGATKDGKAAARFTAKLPEAGRYEVLLASPPNANRSSKVAVEVESSGGKKTVHVDQRKEPAEDAAFVSLGTYDFKADAPAVVTVSNADSDGYVVIDAVQWLKR